MKNHPLTPMWDCDISKLMEKQSKYPCLKIGKLSESWGQLKKDSKSGKRQYLIPDCENEEDIRDIVAGFGDRTLLTGGSGLAQTLAGYLLKKAANDSRGTTKKDWQGENETHGNPLLLAGSCSQATQAQIKDFQKTGGKSFRITPEMILDSSWDIESFWQQIKSAVDQESVLVYCGDTLEGVEKAQRHYKNVSNLLEQVMAALACRAGRDGINKLIVAGGETSGAVVKGLAVKSFMIGESVAPGVPVMIPRERTDMRLILKSGNFGQEDFFSRAVKALNQLPEKTLETELEDMIWVARQLFDRKLVTGGTGNISIFSGQKMYISPGGKCLGRLSLEEISVVDIDGNWISGPRPSKEWPLHLSVYRTYPEKKAVIHTHSRYSVLWSRMDHEDPQNCMPDPTPYLRMRLGTVGIVPFAKPGSEELFQLFEKQIEKSDGWLLQCHGAVVPGKNIMDAFCSMEELEETAFIAWKLRYMR